MPLASCSASCNGSLGINSANHCFCTCDIVVFSSTVDQHLERLQVVLERLQQEGLKVKLSKYAFFQRQVLYLGHMISEKGVSTDPNKVEAVANWEPPTTIYQLRSFLGFASYYRLFEEGFAKLAAPLHRLVAALDRQKDPEEVSLRLGGMLDRGVSSKL